MKNIDRLQGSYTKQEILGISIDRVTLPVAPGREMAVLVETAVRQYILLDRGYDAAEAFIGRQRKAIDSGAEEPD